MSGKNLKEIKQPTPLSVGTTFVNQYYNVYLKEIENLHKMYNNFSNFSHGCTNNTSIETLHGASNIEKEAKKVIPKISKARISSLECQKSINGSIFIYVQGSFVTATNSEQDFTQSFLLAKQENGYFILNDILRYCPERDITNNNSQTNVMTNKYNNTTSGDNNNNINNTNGNYEESEEDFEEKQPEKDVRKSNAQGGRAYHFAVYLSKVPSEATDEQIIKTFEKYGKILDITNKAKEKNFAFVYYETAENVEEAIRHNGEVKIANDNIVIEKRKLMESTPTRYMKKTSRNSVKY